MRLLQRDGIATTFDSASTVATPERGAATWTCPAMPLFLQRNDRALIVGGFNHATQHETRTAHLLEHFAKRTDRPRWIIYRRIPTDLRDLRSSVAGPGAVGEQKQREVDAVGTTVIDGCMPMACT
ncbi:hypothetical protein FVF58_37350 [Paraburkholderia panacisoli]|uniref:Uncharacterized protein n=1 Tax=Paraburkholderia panacisoli TaxID=2603818 RepID=A0A5B0GIV3_9BURK|nr:hypothetical protein FVF58_37350 [Paraburkholderia panacisoli]